MEILTVITIQVMHRKCGIPLIKTLDLSDNIVALCWKGYFPFHHRIPYERISFWHPVPLAPLPFRQGLYGD
jgi:hypothetical protein